MTFALTLCFFALLLLWQIEDDKDKKKNFMKSHYQHTIIFAFGIITHSISWPLYKIIPYLFSSKKQDDQISLNDHMCDK